MHTNVVNPSSCQNITFKTTTNQNNHYFSRNVSRETIIVFLTRLNYNNIIIF